MVMTRDEIVALFSRRGDAWRRHDAGALAADHTDDCILQSPMAGQVIGRDAIERVYRAWFDGFPDCALEIDELVVDGDRIVEVGTASGTDTGGFMGLPADRQGLSRARGLRLRAARREDRAISIRLRLHRHPGADRPHESEAGVRRH